MNNSHPSVRWTTVLTLMLCAAAAELRGTDVVTFNVTVDSFSSTVNGITAGQAATENALTVGILYHLTALDGVAKTFDSMGFCAELAQDISTGTTYNYDIVPISQLDAATAGQTGSASYNIASGGIGTLKAAQLAYLYDKHYAGLTASAWTETKSTPAPIAFQLAQWAIVHSTSLTMTNSSSTYWINLSGNGTENTNAINLAQTWLTQISNANVTSAYTSQTWQLIGLASPTYQDLIVATPMNAYVPVPEPGSAVLVLCAATHTILKRRRRIVDLPILIVEQEATA